MGKYFTNRLLFVSFIIFIPWFYIMSCGDISSHEVRIIFAIISWWQINIKKPSNWGFLLSSRIFCTTYHDIHILLLHTLIRTDGFGRK